MANIIQGRNIPQVYDKLIRTVWTQGRNRIDERNNKIRELKAILIEINTDRISYPGFGPTTIRFGEIFAKGLIDSESALKNGREFEYAYGDRLWQNDLISEAISKLRVDPETRRIVLPIYSNNDLISAVQNIREVPCATQVYLQIADEKLDMTLMMRSNDIVGAFPSDAYGFRKLQEYIANSIGAPIGTYRHYIESAHIITENDQDWVEKFMKTAPRFY